MKSINKLIEVKHGSWFARYIVYPDNQRYLPEYAVKISELEKLELPAYRKKIFEQIKDNIVANNIVEDLSAAYFQQVKPLYENTKENIVVNITDTNASAFNTPINLMMAALCTDTADITISSDRTGDYLMRVFRHISAITVAPYDNIHGQYMYILMHDIMTLNDMSPRSMQFKNMVPVVQTDKFKELINNGNLLLAFADIYDGNLDDDTLEITDLPDGVELINYDQFTGAFEGNEIYLEGPDVSRRYNSVYGANNFDASFVELLQRMIIHKLKKGGS